MDTEQFRECGKAAIDLLADYADNIRDRNVLPSVEPGDLIKKLPENAPEKPEDWKNVLKDFSDIIIPGITNWLSPQFHAYFPAGNSFASTIGSLLSDGIGIVGLTWLASPACTELEVVTMNWLGKLLGLPKEFLNCSSGPGGGVLQASASEATLICLVAAKNKMIRTLKINNPHLDDEEIKSKLIAYTSDQCNSSVEKAGVLGSMKMRQLKTDINGRFRGKTLAKSIEEDKARGLFPCYVVANFGTTGTCAFDALDELGPICQQNNMWLHIDGAYAGTALICPEFRHLMKGVDYANSFNVSPHKWLLVSVDCSALWVKSEYDLVNAFDVQRIYLDKISTANKIPEYRNWQLALGRRFRALKVWMVMRMYGAENLRNHVRNQIELAKYFVSLVKTDERFIIEPEPAMGLVCFRLEGGDIITKKLLDNLTQKKKIFMVAGKFRKRIVIRFAVASRLTTKEDIEVSWNIIKNEANLIYSNCPNTHMNSKIHLTEVESEKVIAYE